MRFQRPVFVFLMTLTVLVGLPAGAKVLGLLQLARCIAGLSTKPQPPALVRKIMNAKNDSAQITYEAQDIKWQDALHLVSFLSDPGVQQNPELQPVETGFLLLAEVDHLQRTLLAEGKALEFARRLQMKNAAREAQLFSRLTEIIYASRDSGAVRKYLAALDTRANLESFVQQTDFLPTYSALLWKAEAQFRSPPNVTDPNQDVMQTPAYILPNPETVVSLNTKLIAVLRARNRVIAARDLAKVTAQYFAGIEDVARAAPFLRMSQQ